MTTLKWGVLTQVYKSDKSVYAVIEELIDVTAEMEDPFLQEARMKVWKKTNRFSLASNLTQFTSVPLLHACYAEDRAGHLLQSLVHHEELYVEEPVPAAAE